jgi:hypothetical protein
MPTDANDDDDEFPAFADAVTDFVAAGFLLNTTGSQS